MRSLILVSILCGCGYFVMGQNVGIGNSSPLSRLQVTNGSVVFNSTITSFPGSPGTELVQGAGVRMVWFPNRAAFRAGAVDNGELNGTTPFTVGSTYWNADSLGRFSAAFGYRTRATGIASFAIGDLSWARGYAAIAMGIGARALGNVAIAAGNGSAEGDYSFAANSSRAVGTYSFAAGIGTIANGNSSVAMGFLNKTSGQASVAMGYENEARGWQAAVFGLGNLGKSQSAFVAGVFNDTADVPASEFQISPANRIFQIGNGLSASNRSNAMTVLQSGSVGVGTTNPLATLHLRNGSLLVDNTFGANFGTLPPAEGQGQRFFYFADRFALRAGQVGGTEWNRDSIGQGSVAIGRFVKAIGTTSGAMGTFATARGDASFAFGTLTLAAGKNATAVGELTNAIGAESFAAGRISEAIGTNSMALGYNAIASGEYSTALGYGTRANGNFATAIGFSAVAAGANALATGQNTNASGAYSSTFGIETRAKAQGAMALGSWNNETDAPNPFVEQATDRIFQIGNGSSGLRSNALTVLRNGNIGIGAMTSPAAQLQFPADIRNRKIVLWSTLDNDHQFYGFGINGGTLRYQTDALGADHVFFAGVNGTTSNELFRIRGNGNATLAGVLTQNSDARLKKDIVPISNTLEALEQINGYTYNWKDETNPEEQIGLLAQEIQKVYPQLVKENEQGTLSVNYSGMVPVLLEAIKQQQKQIEIQNKRIAELERKIKN